MATWGPLAHVRLWLHPPALAPESPMLDRACRRPVWLTLAATGTCQRCISRGEADVALLEQAALPCPCSSSSTGLCTAVRAGTASLCRVHAGACPRHMHSHKAATAEPAHLQVEGDHQLPAVPAGALSCCCWRATALSGAWGGGRSREPPAGADDPPPESVCREVAPTACRYRHS